MIGSVNPTEEAILDRALVATYRAKNITPDPSTQKNPPPLPFERGEILTY